MLLNNSTNETLNINVTSVKLIFVWFVYNFHCISLPFMYFHSHLSHARLG